MLFRFHQTKSRKLYTALVAINTFLALKGIRYFLQHIPNFCVQKIKLFLMRQTYVKFKFQLSNLGGLNVILFLLSIGFREVSYPLTVLNCSLNSLPAYLKFIPQSLSMLSMFLLFERNRFITLKNAFRERSSTRSRCIAFLTKHPNKHK